MIKIAFFWEQIYEYELSLELFSFVKQLAGLI